MLEKIVSGGQTGVDRAALDWAIEHAIPHGGWCPAGRMAEDGEIPARYLLRETPGGYRQRTRWNVRDSDATLIVSLGEVLSGGTLGTRKFAQTIGRPWMHVWPGMAWRDAPGAWLSMAEVRILNVAGPRASKEPEVGAFVRAVLDALWRVVEIGG